jgi:hypothetical protein
VLFDQIGELEEQAGPLMRTHRRPFAFVEGLARGLDRFVDIGLVPFGDESQHFLVGRVDGLEGFAGFRRDPLAADEQLRGLFQEIQYRARGDSRRGLFQ